MFGSGKKIQALESQLRDAEEKLDKVTREKNDLDQQLSSARGKISELEAKFEDFDLEQLKDQARAIQAEFTGLRDLYAKKISDFEAEKEGKEEEFARESAIARRNLQTEIDNNRRENEAYVSDTVRRFSESYNFYLNQIRLLMDALGDVATQTGQALFAGASEGQDLMLTMGQEMSSKLNAQTDDLRGEEDAGLILISNAENVESTISQEAEELAEGAEEAAEDVIEKVEAVEETVAETVEETVEDASAVTF